MPYQLKYILEFKNQQEQTCSLELWQNLEDETPIDPVYLTGSSSPVVQRGINNDRSLYTPIRGQELTAEIVTDELSITDFLADDETTWKAIYKVDDDAVFTGFLLQEDSDEDYVSYKHLLRLRFTDSLALLKGVELRDNNGAYWFADVTLYDLVSACLRKTGLQLDISVLCSIFPADTADVTLTSTLSITKVNTRTFMTNKRDFEDCWTVLTKIMTAMACTLYQYGGRWVIDRWGDRLEQATREFSYDVNGDATYVGTTYTTKAIGETQPIKEVEAPKLLSIMRAAKEDRITYRFDNWPELIRNLDLDDGTVNLLLSGPSQRTYSLDHYTLVSRTAYSRREIDALGNETQRYMFINGAANNLDLDKYVQTTTFPAVKGDKIKLSFAASSSTDLPTTAAVVYLKCGSYYLDDDATWKTAAVFLRLDFASAENSTEWKTYEIESKEIPADGNVELRFLLMQGCGVGNTTRYKDVNVEYVPVINNSYGAVGDFNLYPNPVTTKNPISEQVHLSDALKKVVKGALLKSSGALETTWQRGTNTEEYRFSQLNALAYYQSSYRTKFRMEGTFRGVDSAIGFKPQYSFDDVAGKKFFLASLDEIDWRTCVWKGTLVEIHDDTADAGIETLPSGYVYNYIFQ